MKALLLAVLALFCLPAFADSHYPYIFAAEVDSRGQPHLTILGQNLCISGDALVVRFAGEELVGFNCRGRGTLAQPEDLLEVALPLVPAPGEYVVEVVVVSASVFTLKSSLNISFDEA